MSTMEVNTLLSDDAFQNEHSRSLFDAIDKLRSCGAEQDIGLPELVIVGDQSAGKSSLLQSLTDIPFPVASSVCTRFPTRIVSRRTFGQRETSTVVSIEAKLFSVFDSGKPAQRQARFDEFKRSFSTMTKADFARAIEDATDAMGIKHVVSNEATSTTSDQMTGQNFSDHVLKVEISGPDRSHFSILDVPGIFQSLTGRLTEMDKTGVEKMVSSYMLPEQSIIICVASGTNDIANQAIFDMEGGHDQGGARTVGVITKCDVAEHRQGAIMNDAENKEKHLRHGWFVVRNRTPSEVEEGIGPLERYTKEQNFFNQKPWNKLPEHRRGTQALKKYLAELLCARIEEDFPTLLHKIRIIRDETASNLEALGEARTSVEQKRSYLTRIAYDFNLLATQALQGRYDRMANNDMKLRMKVRDANEGFVLEMNKNGHFLPFVEQMVSQNTGKPPNPFPNNVEATRSDPGSQKPTSFGSLGSSDSTNATDFGIFGGIAASEHQKPKATASTQSASGLGFGQFGSGQSRSGQFGSSPQAGKVRPVCPGTKFPPFQTFIQKETDGKEGIFQSISSMCTYKDYSFEELRLSDYAQGQPSSTTSGEPSTLVFGRPFEPPFDQPKQAQSIFSTPNRTLSDLFPKPTQTQSTFSTPDGTSSNHFANPSKPASAHSNLSSGHSSKIEDRNGESTSVVSLTTKSSLSTFHEPACQIEHTKMYGWIRNEIKASRGIELQGTMNPDVLPILFHKQARNWRKISESHFSHTTLITCNAMRQVLDTVCKDKLTMTKIASLMREADAHSKDRFLALLSRRVDNILSSHLQTSNPAFEQKVSDARKARFRGALERYRTSRNNQTKARSAESSFSAESNMSKSYQDDNQLIIDMRDVGALFAELHISNSQNLEDEVHDTLKAYYEIAKEDFIEYVTQLIVEPFLHDPAGPVLFFSPLYVAGLKDEDIQALGAEDEVRVRERAKNEETLARLNQAEKIAREYTRK